MENIINDYAFASELDQFKLRVLDPQQKKVGEAWVIMSDLHYPWKDDEQKKLASARLENYKEWLEYYKKFHAEGMKLVMQHEQLTNNISKWYDKWYSDISNEGKQETEMMSIQADMLQEIFVEIYKVLKPLNLDIKVPKALNL